MIGTRSKGYISQGISQSGRNRPIHSARAGRENAKVQVYFASTLATFGLANGELTLCESCLDGLTSRPFKYGRLCCQSASFWRCVRAAWNIHLSVNLCDCLHSALTNALTPHAWQVPIASDTPGGIFSIDIIKSRRRD